MAHAPKREYLPNTIIVPAQALLPLLAARRILPEAKADVEYIDPSFTAEAMAARLREKGAVIVGGFFQSYSTPPKTRIAAGIEHFYFPKDAALPDMKARPPLAVIVFGMVKVGSADCVRLMVPGLPKPLLMSFAKFKACSRPLEGHRRDLEAKDAAERAAAARAGAAGPGGTPAPAASLMPAERARQIAFLRSMAFPQLMEGRSLTTIFPSDAASASAAESSFRQSCFMHLARANHLPAGITDFARLSDDHIRAAISAGHLTPEDIVAPATTSAPAAVSAPARPDGVDAGGGDGTAFAAEFRKRVAAERARKAKTAVEAARQAAAKKTEPKADKGALLDAAVAAEASGGYPVPAAAPRLASSGGRLAAAGAVRARPAPTGPALPLDEPEAARGDHSAVADRSATLAALRNPPSARPEELNAELDRRDRNAWTTCCRRATSAGVLCVTRGVPTAFGVYNLYRGVMTLGTTAAWLWNSLPTGVPEILLAGAAGSAASAGAGNKSLALVCYPGDPPDPSFPTCPAPGASSWF